MTLTGASNGGTVSGTVGLGVDAVIDGVLGRVDFYVDGVYRGSDTLAPFTFSWDTRSEAVGPHLLEARGYEAQYASETRSATVTVHVVGTTLTMPEDSKFPPTVRAADLLVEMTDPDPGARRGLAVVGVEGGGNWQYTLDGRAWRPLSGASEAGGWLLPDTARLRFLPAANWSGTALLRFRGWDRTWGAVGTRVVVPPFDPSSPFTSAVGLASAVVVPVNDRPIARQAAVLLPPVAPYPADSTGVRVAELVRGATDVDGDVLGVAITAAIGRGFWQYSVDGANWTPIDLSSVFPRMLAPSAWVRFVPAAGATAPGTLSFRAWDQTPGAGGLSVGQTRATVPINAAPVLDPSATPTLPPLPEDAAVNRGGAVTALLDAVFSDPDGPRVPRGVAVTAVGTVGGVWQYSIDGVRWAAVGNVSEGSALLLRSSDRLRFVPAAHFHGQVDLWYRGWDQTAGRTGGRGDTTAPGGSSPFSVEQVQATLTVMPVNDPPGPAPGYAPGLLRLAAGMGGSRVADLLTGWVTDVDGDPVGMAVTGLGAAGGTWWYSADGQDWRALTGVSASSALLLRPTDYLRFVPRSGFNGSAELRFRAWDGTRGVAGSRGRLPSGAVSPTELTVVVWVNGAPTLP